MRTPRRAVPAFLLAGLLVCLLLLGRPGAALAHPLGNFTINHISNVSISEDAVAVHYILDQAEIPTFQERRLTDQQSIARKTAATVAGLAMTVDGRRVALVPVAPGRLSKPMGQGGLRTTRLELDLRASVSDPRRVALDDETYADRIGWRAIVIQPGRGTAVRTTEAYSRDATDGLRQYPVALLQTPLNQRSATFAVNPGKGTVSAPRGPDGPTRKVDGSRGSGDARSGGDGFAAVFADAAAGRGVIVLLLLASFAWGAFHALSPGHGKVMVAAYLVGTKGTARDAVALGGIVTVTHTIGVFALGLITLALSQYILPETLYPYLNLTAGLLVVAVGIGALRDRLRGRTHGHAHDHGHDHAHSHDHDHSHDHGHTHDHGQAVAAPVHSHGGGRPHSHLPPDQLTTRGLLGMGAAAGLIPCPSALVVLLGAIAQHQIGLGLLLIVVFSLGLAATLTGLGLVVVHSKARLPTGRGGRLAAALPSVSAAVILAVGCALTLQAIPGLT